MLLGIRIQNFGLFKDDCIGALLPDIRKAPEQSSLAISAGVDVAHPLNGIEALIVGTDGQLLQTSGMVYTPAK